MAAATLTLVKPEVDASSASSCEDEIQRILGAAPPDKGLSQDQLMGQLTSFPADERTKALNGMLAANRIEIVRTAGSSDQKAFAFRLTVSRVATPVGLDAHEQLLHSCIADSAERGIWIRDLRDRTGLSDLQMRKALKTLESKRIIKAVKAVGTTKKCYILFDVEPDTALSGGTFYSDQQLDSELVTTLTQLAVAILQSRRKAAVEEFPSDAFAQIDASYVSATQIANDISARKVVRCDVSVSDVDRILETAALDGHVVRRADGQVRAAAGASASHRAFDLEVAPLAQLPCIHCPLLDDCRPGCVIEPAGCVYLADWLAK